MPGNELILVINFVQDVYGENEISWAQVVSFW